MQKGDAEAALAEMQQEADETAGAWRVGDGVSRTRAEGRVRCRACRADREIREDVAAYSIAYVLSLSAARPTGPSNGWKGPSNIMIPRSARSPSIRCSPNIHADPRWLPFLRKTRHGTRAARGDQVRREGAEVARGSTSVARRAPMTTRRRSEGHHRRKPPRHRSGQAPRSSRPWPPRS